MKLTQKEYLKAFRKVLEKMYDLTESKNSDYSSDKDAFANMRLADTLGICSTEQAVMVRMCDKLSRIANIGHKEYQVKNETVCDTLLDLAVYSVIMYLMVENEKEEDDTKIGFVTE